MDRDVVHYELTKEWAVEVMGPRLNEPGLVEYLAELIARGNKDIDEIRGVLVLIWPYHRLIHFSDWDEVEFCSQHALRLGHPYVVGAVLHQAQDYFSHFGEGYRMESWGHSYHLLRWRLRNQKVIEKFYRCHSRETLEMHLQALYPEVSLSRFSDWELMDLYLRERSLSRWEERGIYGYNPDLYYEHTWRDREMKEVTCSLLSQYTERLLSNPEWLENVRNRHYRVRLSLLARFYTQMLILGRDGHRLS